MLAGMLERRLIALGRHATAFDHFYWIYALLALAIGVALSLVTGLWGLAGITLASFAGVAILARRRYERSQSS
jgi:membrane protein implicated in regulation of membrane protease activity